MTAPLRIDLRERDILSVDEANALKGRLIDTDSVPIRHVLRDEPADVYLPDGRVLARFRPRSIPRDVCKAAEPTFVAAGAGQSRNRMKAMGVRKENSRWIKGDGTASRTQQLDYRRYPDLKTVGSQVVGSFDRYVRYPFCRQTAFTLDHVELIERGLPMVQAISELFRETVPDRWAVQRAFCDHVHRSWILPGTVFSTITVNTNFVTAVHADSGDLGEGFGCLSILRAGTYGGGHTVLIRYGVAVDLFTSDVLFYDVHELHGNLPLLGRPGNHRRVALVCYLREKMVRCGSPDEELARAQQRRPGDPIYTKAEIDRHREVRREILR